MKHITQNELRELSNCKTVADMLIFLNENYNLNIVPGTISKVLLVNGLVQAIELLKPERRVKITINANKNS